MLTLADLGDVIGGVLSLALLVLAIWGICYLCTMPGKIAKERNHPSTDAINICAWIGLLFWPCLVAAFIWAHTVPAKISKDPQAKPKSQLSINRPLKLLLLVVFIFTALILTSILLTQ